MKLIGYLHALFLHASRHYTDNIDRQNRKLYGNLRAHTPHRITNNRNKHKLLFSFTLFAEKVFSFLSKDEVEKLKQEDEKKMATLQRDKKHKTLADGYEDDEENGDGDLQEVR